MEGFFSFINAILLVGSIQGIILGTLLVIKRKRFLANRILAITIYFLSFSILLHLCSHQNIFPLMYEHHVIIAIISILVSPLFYFYVRSLTENKFILKKEYFIQFLPFFTALLVGVLLMLKIFNNEIQKIIGGIIEYLAGIVFLIYIVLANWKLYLYGKLIKNNYSNLEKINLIWLRVFIYCISFLCIFSGLMDLFFKTISFDIFWLFCSVFIFLIGYFGFNQPYLFSRPLFESDINKDKDIKKYEKSSLTAEMADKYLKKIQKCMFEEKIYLESDLSLSHLSERLGISVHHLSRIINEHLHMNFYDYINSQRIEESKLLLSDPNFRNQNIASIGFTVGFNSLSAFNSAFKKFTHKTPSQYRNELK